MELIKENKKIFSVLFIVLVAVLSHFRYIIGDVEFYSNVNNDSFSQLIRMTPFLEENILDRQWSWSYGLGGDIFSEFSYYYTTSPFFYLQLFLKKILSFEIQDYDTIMTFKIITNIVRQSLAMIFMYVLLIYEKKKKNYSALLGAICYGTSMFFFSFSSRFDFMNDCYVWIPLTFLAFRYYEREKKILPFLAAIALTIGNSFYFGFINCVFYGVYFLWFSYSEGISGKEYFFKIMKIIFLCIIGLGISSVFFLPSVRALLMSDRNIATGNLSIIPDINILRNFYGYFFSLDGLLTIPFFVTFSIYFLKGVDKNSLFFRKMIFMVFWLFMVIIPIVGSIMNGFSYNSDRWYYVVIFAAAYFIPDLIEEINKRKKLTVTKIGFIYIMYIAMLASRRIGGGGGITRF